MQVVGKTNELKTKGTDVGFGCYSNNIMNTKVYPTEFLQSCLCQSVYHINPIIPATGCAGEFQ